MDFTNDCVLNLADMAGFAQDWLDAADLPDLIIFAQGLSIPLFLNSYNWRVSHTFSSFFL